MKNYRQIARVVVEAATPLAVGSGKKEINTDATVAKDVNGLPYIPGSSIAGVVRHALEDQGVNLNDFFGYQENGEGKGSEIMFSEAKMIGKDGVAIDGLQDIDFSDSFYSHFNSLPVRQHVRIGHTGAAEKHGKFDEEVALKGTRFCFEIEAVLDCEENRIFTAILDALYNAEFRIGSGSRKGFGKIVVKSCNIKVVDLTDKADLDWYLNHTSDLSEAFDGSSFTHDFSSNADVYTLTLQPEDFFLFGAGFGDDETDLVPVKEKQVCWEKAESVEKPIVNDNKLLIPASSLKGALVHRVAFHYNVMKEKWAETVTSQDDVKALTVNNPAVVALFGSADNNKKRGVVLFEDIIEDSLGEKIFSHVQIDRFTGGAIEGALFQEKATYGKGSCFKTNITVLENVEDDIKEALELAIEDICKGMLPLGGGTTKGYGCFKGTLQKNNEFMFPK